MHRPAIKGPQPALRSWKKTQGSWDRPAQPSSNMGLSTSAPSVAILLLLFLSWMPLAGRSHPLVASGQDSELWEIQELLDRLRTQVSSRTDAKLMAVEPLQQSQGPSGSGEAALEGHLGHRGRPYQALRGLKVSKKVFSSSCFGQRIDRISSATGLGCNVLKRN
ncbi:PREDICTED: natriuretic peptides B [Dipodomys ordii]|uniref:Natriuretic peptides B n=1 Tax=Dipodomys ordii TaxID=10020 RepID=A0A1S3GK39_DIPOR|nr:PREDICTED: natriuretic peptides B [Dipodomys ordii]XP_012889065.1 PREDICTED: natriuretic peptides B [Dipodomys ordii]